MHRRFLWRVMTANSQNHKNEELEIMEMSQFEAFAFLIRLLFNWQLKPSHLLRVLCLIPRAHLS